MVGKINSKTTVLAKLSMLFQVEEHNRAISVQQKVKVRLLWEQLEALVERQAENRVVLRLRMKILGRTCNGTVSQILKEIYQMVSDC
jgi:hypothetical protein